MTPEWRELFMRFPDRFVYGSDTWVTSRWPEVPALPQPRAAGSPSCPWT